MRINIGISDFFTIFALSKDEAQGVRGREVPLFRTGAEPIRDEKAVECGSGPSGVSDTTKRICDPQPVWGCISDAILGDD